MANRAVKVTVSVPHDLVEVADEVAHERNVSRSRVISACLEDLAAEHLRQRMAEGYKALAKDNLSFAEHSIRLVHEVLSPED